MKYSLSDPDPAVAQAVSRWLRDHLGRPHPLLGRPGPVCPFVVPAIKANALSIRQHRWHGPPTSYRLTGLLDAVVDHFHAGALDGRPGDLRTLVVPVTGFPEAAWSRIDDGRRRAKTRAAVRGYMLGQFHPACTEPGIRNPVFPVNRAPLPVFAVRRMAVHDILFLHDDPIWFEQYQRRFAGWYRDGGRVGPQLRELYAIAARRHARGRQAEPVAVHGRPPVRSGPPPVPQRIGPGRNPR
ncbi:DUF6875 domain-containing protein [Nocardia sp. NPDC003693]